MFEKGVFVNGVLTLPDGETREGTFKDGKLEGDGVIIPKAGDTYKGLFEKGVFVSGVLTLPDGETRKGTFKDGKLEGENCTLKNTAGYTLKGLFKKGALANGEITLPNGVTKEVTFEDSILFIPLLFAIVLIVDLWKKAARGLAEVAPIQNWEAHWGGDDASLNHIRVSQLEDLCNDGDQVLLGRSIWMDNQGLLYDEKRQSLTSPLDLDPMTLKSAYLYHEPENRTVRLHLDTKNNGSEVSSKCLGCNIPLSTDHLISLRRYLERVESSALHEGTVHVNIRNSAGESRTVNLT